jgi:hypothetical protein
MNVKQRSAQKGPIRFKSSAFVRKGALISVFRTPQLPVISSLVIARKVSAFGKPFVY